MVGELYRLAEKSQKRVQKPTGQGRLLQWYFFLVTAFWMYFRWVSGRPLLLQCGLCPSRQHALHGMQPSFVSWQGRSGTHPCDQDVRVRRSMDCISTGQVHHACQGCKRSRIPSCMQVHKESAGRRNYLERPDSALIWLGAQETHHFGFLPVHCWCAFLVCLIEGRI